mmetsp:Transcript_63358/g.196258  ORF Transcript_63358/g.196258 Transcript_63358/m.196258 type:complete len:256 (+) Transcript_63358:73-840(+)
MASSSRHAAGLSWEDSFKMLDAAAAELWLSWSTLDEEAFRTALAAVHAETEHRRALREACACAPELRRRVAWVVLKGQDPGLRRVCECLDLRAFLDAYFATPAMRTIGELEELRRLAPAVDEAVVRADTGQGGGPLELGDLEALQLKVEAARQERERLKSGMTRLLTTLKADLIDMREVVEAVLATRADGYMRTHGRLRDSRPSQSQAGPVGFSPELLQGMAEAEVLARREQLWARGHEVLSAVRESYFVRRVDI